MQWQTGNSSSSQMLLQHFKDYKRFKTEVISIHLQDNPFISKKNNNLQCSSIFSVGYLWHPLLLFMISSTFARVPFIWGFLNMLLLCSMLDCNPFEKYLFLWRLTDEVTMSHWAVNSSSCKINKTKNTISYQVPREGYKEGYHYALDFLYRMKI